jgi:hypothetical protein
VRNVAQQKCRNPFKGTFAESAFISKKGLPDGIFQNKKSEMWICQLNQFALFA